MEHSSAAAPSNQTNTTGYLPDASAELQFDQLAELLKRFLDDSNSSPAGYQLVDLLQEAHHKAIAEKDKVIAEKDKLLKTVERKNRLLEMRVRRRDDGLEQSVRETSTARTEAERAKEEAKVAKEANPDAPKIIYRDSQRRPDNLLSYTLTALNRHADVLETRVAQQADHIGFLKEMNTLLKDRIIRLLEELCQLKVEKAAEKKAEMEKIVADNMARFKRPRQD
ncbi:hypothetical protein W97_07258 [Coniosporium apollinis CBS 100218]|uniref:Uncharacterized protein n=1 Tax=Coniosporium apollinis (strain CBS 100218) TaxID=1168221 RepID=R7Z1Q9_CONA1|nr:uncharacterized protein W97_07258 [Coniosporium apollinis CBS 100218]EON68110.1 hypothetical protein W97_07258 [Coniosporium apollinis CBS 100218]